MINLMRRLWGWLRRPSPNRALGSLLLIGGVGALTLWAGFSSSLHYSNTLGFCSSCHDMDVVVEEYKQSPHYRSASGVQAICSDCHVARALIPKLTRKIRATFVEVPSHLRGTIGTREKFLAKRLELAEHVWAEMKANDSRECRACHNRDAMALEEQKPRARAQHEDAVKTGETCIDCHKGIAHHMPEQPTEPDASEDFAL